MQKEIGETPPYELCYQNSKNWRILGWNAWILGKTLETCQPWANCLDEKNNLSFQTLEPSKSTFYVVI
jgi:hypothetical protein